jgi:hypothetical protein
MKNYHSQFSSTEKEPSAILELTGLLVAGLCSEGLSDFLSSSEQMSERVDLSNDLLFKANFAFRLSRNGSPR